MHSINLKIALGLVLAALFADDAAATNWKLPPEETAVEPLYPYKDLPGVKAQPPLKEEEQYSCRTQTEFLRRRGDIIFRSGMPTLMYVCERDGVVSHGNKVPLRGHFQPVR
ncbi:MULTISPECIES: hypothetical protein [unclassified Sinorhizobium]|uniref:hypothetical protein n=1 Tax=unclassified Sinorhizobium TaxID=2613772 RepID=UPI00352544A2